MPAATSTSISRVLGTVKGCPSLIRCAPSTRKGNMGTISAPVSRAMRMAPGGSVVSRPKKVTGTPFWKKS